MDISPYAFSKFLSVSFSKYYTSSETWKNISNDFTQSVYKIVPEYNEFKARANKIINQSEIHIKRSAVAEKELEKAKSLKREWHEFVSRFCELERTFENKYKDQLDEFDTFMESDENKNEFLAEYSAYSYLESMYESLARFEDDLDDYRSLCIKYRPQTQPSSN